MALTKDEIREVLHSELAPLRDDVKLMKHHITGNGTPERGLIARMLLLEHKAAQGGWFATTAIGAIVAAVVAAVVSLFR